VPARTRSIDAFVGAVDGIFVIDVAEDSMAYRDLLSPAFQADPMCVSGPEIVGVKHFSIAIDAPEMALAYDDLPKGARDFFPAAVFHAAVGGAEDLIALVDATDETFIGTEALSPGVSVWNYEYSSQQGSQN
jgi:hypothetical protein